MTRFLIISNLNVSKGIFVVLDAAALLLKDTTDFHVHFVGAPTAEISAERMLQEIERRELLRVVTYHGKQYGADKEARFAEADCFLHPTLDDCFPLVILEAMQHALPVITTPVGAIPDMVENGEAGVLIPPNNAVALASALKDMMLHVNSIVAMGTNAATIFASKFTIKQFEKTLISILKE